MNDFDSSHPFLTTVVVIIASIIGAKIGVFLAALVDAMKALEML